MSFKEKYTNNVEKDPKKDEISLESYAICELLEQIIKKLNEVRFK